MWMVDLDHVPAPRGPLRALLRFDAADHLGDPHATIRANVDAFLAEHGEARPARVLLLANPRSLGHAFNPLSVFWCFDARGSLRAVVAEVQNTYGERHCYLLHPDDQGNAHAGKELYVSPFFPVDGRYEMQLTDPRETLDVAIALHREERAGVPRLAARRAASSRALVGCSRRCATRCRRGGSAHASGSRGSGSGGEASRSLRDRAARARPPCRCDA